MRSAARAVKPWHQANVTQRVEIEMMVKAVLDAYGRIDILFNNAGFGRLDWLENLNPERDIETQVQVNLVGLETGGGRAPAFRYPALAGDTVWNVSLRGKVVLVNFWATWCPPCMVEMPLLQSMAERHAAAGLVVLGLSRDRAAPTEVAAFLAERGITNPVAIVGPEAERRFGGVQGYPTSFLLDRSGPIRHKALGPLAMVSFEPAVRRLLAESADDGPRHAGGRTP